MLNEIKKSRNHKNITDHSFQEQRILSTNKIIIFTLPNALFTAMLGMMVTFTLVFYISILGLPVIIIGLIYAMGLFTFAIMGIMWGAIADKLGKQKVLRISGILMAIVFVGVWTAPAPSKSEPYGSVYLPAILWFVGFSVAFRITSAAFQSIFFSLLPEVSNSEQNRVKIAMIHTFLTTIGFVIGMMIPFVITGIATSELKNDKAQLYFPISPTGQAIYTSISLFSVLLSISFFITFMLMLKKIHVSSTSKEDFNSFYNIVSTLSEPFRDTNYKRWLVCYLLFWIPFVAFQYLLLNMAAFMLQLRGIELFLFIAIGVFIVFISIIVWQIVAKQLGIKGALMLCLTGSTIAFSLQFIVLIFIQHIIFLTLEIILLYFLLFELVGIMAIPLAIMSNLIEQAKVSRNIDLSATYSGAFTTFASVGSGIAMLIVSLFLSLFGIENPMSYGSIFLVGSIMILVSCIIFHKIEVKR